jgi:hypothetical protein
MPQDRKWEVVSECKGGPLLLNMLTQVEVTMASESSVLLPHWTSCPLGLRHREVEFWLVLIKVQQSNCLCCYLTFLLL